MRIGTMIASALLLVTLSTTAEAYRYRTCSGIPLRMSSNSVPVYSSDNSFPAGYWRDGLQNAINQFNRNPSNVFYTRYSDTNGVALNNGQNEVWGSTNQSILQGAPAIAYSYWDCYWLFGWVARMKEGDVIFNYTNTAADPFEWTATRSKTALFNYTGTGRLLQATAIHEFGHAVGLLHVNTTYNVMGSDFSHVQTNGATTNAYIGEDTGNGTVFLYGLWASGPQDLGVAHWRYSGASGEYSTHAKTRVFNSAGALLPTVNVANETGYQVKRGMVIRAEFTKENNGRATASAVPIRYYVSTNDLISTTDRLLASGTITLGRDVVLTSSTTMTIPTNLALNTNYWLGVIINPTASVAETDRSNNATYIPIRVVP